MLISFFLAGSPEPDDLDGSYLGTPTALAINDTNKVKRSQPFTTRGQEETTAVGQSQPAAVSQSERGTGAEAPALPSAAISSIDDLRKVPSFSTRTWGRGPV